jgi:hypothetical protein
MGRRLLVRVIKVQDRVMESLRMWRVQRREGTIVVISLVEMMAEGKLEAEISRD